MKQDSPIQLTQSGYQKLLDELNQLKDKKRPVVVKQLSTARDQGDLSENAGYHSARQALDMLDSRIDELEGTIQSAQVVSKKRSNKTIALSSQVTVALNGKTQTYTIVSKFEADPASQLISSESPLGKALVGKKIGDKVEVKAPAGVIKYTIKKIK